jgi:hypothetical protein
MSGIEGLYRMFLAEGLRPETKAQTLLVGNDSGVANIYVWATSKNIPWAAPAGGLAPVNVKFRDGKLTNRCLKVVVNQKLQFENRDPVDHSLAAEFFKARNSSFNFVVKAESKYERELSFPVSARKIVVIASGNKLAVLCGRPGQQESIQLLDANSGKLKRELKLANLSHGGAWLDFAYSASEQLLIAAGSDKQQLGSIDVWDFENRAVVSA